MARKGWDQLSDNYRKRLQRSGVSREEYSGGISISKARGHKSQAQENARRRERRAVERTKREYAKEYARTYSVDYDDILEALNSGTEEQAKAWMDWQQAAERAYLGDNHMEGSPKTKHAREIKPPDQPHLLEWYHSLFS